MRVINLRGPCEFFKSFTYPDGQPHVNISGVESGDRIKVVAPIRNPLELLLLIQTSNALSNLKAEKEELYIPYLMGARFDRLMSKGDSVDLRVISDMINYCEFKRVKIFDVHSDVALQLINNSENIDNRILVQSYTKEDSVLICPDTGASKKILNYFGWNNKFSDLVYCIKSRDLSNKGRISLTVLQPEKCKDKNCIIIDDLCDGGGTFIEIAKQLDKLPLTLTLVVSHGIFSKGFGELETYFDEIITSDSFYNVPADGFPRPNWVKIVNLNF